MIPMTGSPTSSPIVVEFDTGEMLVLRREYAVAFAALVRHVATCGPDSLDQLDEEFAP